MAKAKKIPAKKNAGKKKRKYTPPLKFEDFTPQVQKKAKGKVASLKGFGAYALKRAAQDKLPPVPTQKFKKVRVEERVSSDGRGWANTLHPVDTIIKNIKAAAAKVKAKGVKDCKLEMSNWDGVTISGYREETDAEFQKRVLKAQVERATIVLARRVHGDAIAEEEKQLRERNKRRKEDRFKEAARAFTQKDRERLLKDLADEETPKKETNKVGEKGKKIKVGEKGKKRPFR